MKYTKVVYFRYLPLTVKVYEDFYMDELIKINLITEYWDLSYLFFGEIEGVENSIDLSVTICKFTNYKQLENSIKEQDVNTTLFISIVTLEGRVIRLYKLLTKYNCRLAVFGRNVFPSANCKKGLLRRVSKLNIPKIVNRLLDKKMLKLRSKNLIKGYDILFQAGNFGWKGVGIVSESDFKNTDIVSVNSDDYDRFLELSDKIRLVHESYILFLDEYLPLHPDARLLNIRNVSEDEYYPLLNKFFKIVENQFKMPVVIAAHPKALRYKEVDFFEGRTVMFGKTGILARDAFFVLAHDSTSVNYPIAFRKKMHFITSKAIEKRIEYIHDCTILLAEQLGCNWQYIDNLDCINLIENINEELYTKYVYDYMSSIETYNKYTSQIFLKYLCS